MPSRKKLQGKSRKSKRATAATTSLSSENACLHLGHLRTNRSNSDLNAANELSLKLSMELKFADALDCLSCKSRASIPETVHDIYDKYNKFSDTRKELFRAMIVCYGTQVCTFEASNLDLKMASFGDALPHVLIGLTIEHRERYDGAMNDIILGKIRRSLDDIMNCPRQTVRFFHKRNCCDCLKELYHNLKESTKRTAGCYNCNKVFDIRELSRCQYCNVAQFCTYECAVAHWPSHKEQCKLWRGCQSV